VLIPFVTAELDFDTKVMTVEGVDGQIFTDRWTDEGHETNICKARLDLRTRTVEFRLRDGDSATLELPIDDPTGRPLLAERRVVYLDQNHWSSIAAWISDRRPGSDKHAAAADQLSRLVEARSVVLPFSAGHLVETGALYGEHRVELASAVLAMSRGWQMRSPWNVRRDELAGALNDEAPVARDVFTLSGDELFTRRLKAPDTSGLPRFAAELTSLLTYTTSLCDVLLDPEQIPDEGGRAAFDSWAQSHADAARLMRDHEESRETVWRVANACLLVDAIDEIREVCGPDQSRAVNWLPRAERDVGAMPSFGRMRWLIFTRLRNASEWKGNDFTDMHYLSCAAGYADLVVGERRTIGDLRTARGLTAGARLAATLPEAVAILSEMGVSLPNGDPSRSRPKR
jgi:hypothetical protein